MSKLAITLKTTVKNIIAQIVGEPEDVRPTAEAASAGQTDDGFNRRRVEMIRISAQIVRRRGFRVLNSLRRGKR